MKVVLLLLALVIFVSGCTSTAPEQVVKAPTITILEPEDGAKISDHRFKVRIRTTNFELAAPQEENKEHRGHVHVWVNDEWEVVSRFPYEIEGLEPGSYVIRVVLHNDDHSKITPEVSDEVTITIPEPDQPAPKVFFVNPKDRETLTENDITVVLGIENIQMTQPGGSNKDGEGHIRVSLNGEKQEGAKTTFSFTDVPDGDHTLTTELLSNDGTLIEEQSSEEIEITVFTKKQDNTKTGGKTVKYAILADEKGYMIDGADITSLSVNKDDTVEITFSYDDNDIYFGGLDLKASNGAFPTIRYSKGAGGTDTVSFTATESFDIDSYWPASNQFKAKLQIKVS